MSKLPSICSKLYISPTRITELSRLLAGSYDMMNFLSPVSLYNNGFLTSSLRVITPRRIIAELPASVVNSQKYSRRAFSGFVLISASIVDFSKSGAISCP